MSSTAPSTSVTGYRFYNVPTTATQKWRQRWASTSCRQRKCQFNRLLRFSQRRLPTCPPVLLLQHLIQASPTHRAPIRTRPVLRWLLPELQIESEIRISMWMATTLPRTDSMMILSQAANSSTGDIKGKVLVNAKVSWHVTSQFSLFVNGRNALNNKSREFSEQTGWVVLYLIGASFSLN